MMKFISAILIGGLVTFILEKFIVPKTNFWVLLEGKFDKRLTISTLFIIYIILMLLTITALGESLGFVIQYGLYFPVFISYMIHLKRKRSK